MKKLKLFWHIHHDVLLEPLTEPLKNRIKYIKENKPKDEIELRLKLMKPVKGELPLEFVEAWQKYKEMKWDSTWERYDNGWFQNDKAWESCDKEWLEYMWAKQKYNKMWQKYLSQIEALHKKECPRCPMKWRYSPE